MNKKLLDLFSFSIKKLNFKPNQIRNLKEKLIINSNSLSKIEKFSEKNNSTFSTCSIHKNRKKYFLSTISGKFPNISNNKYNNIYQTLFNAKNSKNAFPKINLSYEIHPNNKYTINNSIFSRLNKSRNSNIQYINNLKKSNFIFMKDNESYIDNIHTKLMKSNRISLCSEKNIDDNKYMEEEEKIVKPCITEENKKLFDIEYNKVCKDKLKEKKIIIKEINDIGKRLSFLNDYHINKSYNFIKKNKSTKIMLIKDPINQINNLSSFPYIMNDSKILLHLWNKNKTKYFKCIIDDKSINRSKKKIN